MNPITNREIEFLNESNKIENIHEINYHNNGFQSSTTGHFGAYVVSRQLAVEHKSLSVKILKHWQKMIGEEQKKHTTTEIGDEEIGHIRSPFLQKEVRIGNHIPPKSEHVPSLLQFLIEDVNQDLTNHFDLYRYDDEAFAQFAGKYFLLFERIHPFADGNGRMGRLVANYLATYCDRPILVFPSEYCMRNRYIEAHESEDKMGQYFLKRMKESHECHKQKSSEELTNVQEKKRKIS